MDLWVREARIFKYGSGTARTFSQIRGEGKSLSRRRQVIGTDELPEDRDRAPGPSSRAHDPPGGEDGRARSRPSDIEEFVTGRSSRSRKSPPSCKAPSCSTSTSTPVLKACHNWPKQAERFDAKLK